MLTLVMTACLLVDMKHCQEQHLLFSSEELTPMQCVMGAQPEIARWQDEHPKWFVKRWSCTPKRFANI
jgi:hypothetical protein